MNEKVMGISISLKRPSFELNIDCSIQRTGVTVIFGHSGSGKTTLLRCIAGLEKSIAAKIVFGGETWQNGKKFVLPHQRPVGYVFQESSLFEHLSAEENINFALKRAVKNKTVFCKEHVIDMLGIANVLKQYPEQLSGGERQRVAIARALLIQPEILLMDEPLASLDNARKKEILPYLEKLKKEFNIPIIYVTHSPDEVARLADDLIVLSEGKIQVQGSLSHILSRMDNPLGVVEEAGVVLEGKVVELDARWHLAKVKTACGDFWLRDLGHNPGTGVRIRILASDVSLSLKPSKGSSIVNVFPAVVKAMAVDIHPGLTLVQLKVGAELMLARVSSRSAHELKLGNGKNVWVQIKSVAIVQ